MHPPYKIEIRYLFTYILPYWILVSFVYTPLLIHLFYVVYAYSFVTVCCFLLNIKTFLSAREQTLHKANQPLSRSVCVSVCVSLCCGLA